MKQRTDVVVVGGGYAGVMAANRLVRAGGVSVTLVNPRPVFVERIRLHQLAGGTHEAVLDYRKVLAAGVQLVVGAAKEIDAAGRRVILADGGTLGYDYLVYAVGSGSGSASPGFAYPVGGLEQAARLRQVLAGTPVTAPVTVVGAGPTGIETAAELAEQGRAVTLVAGPVLGPYLHRRARRAVSAQLAGLGVTVVEGPLVTAVRQDAVQLSDGRERPSAVTVWTAGFGVPELATRSGLSTDGLGRLRTDVTLTSVDDDRIVAAGDSAALADRPVRMSCQAAMQLGPRAAETVLSRIAGRPPAPVGVIFAGQCLSLGRGTGVFQVSRRDDTATGLFLGGRTGARLKEFICRSIVWQLARAAGPSRQLQSADA